MAAGKKKRFVKGTEMRNKILIYQDYGCADVSSLESELKKYFEPRGCMVGFTDAAGIIKNNELDDTALAFFMPGGAGTPYRRKLEVLGNEKIRDYVHNGGIYYGICAGAYYACQQTVFEEDVPELKIISECGLNLIDGKAVGTLYKELGIRPYAKNASSAAVIELIWLKDQSKHVVYYHGGPYFDLKNAAENEILAVYDLAGQPPAIVRRRYGKGSVIVSGVHYEDSGSSLLKAVHALRLDSAEAANVARKLSAGENSRQALFNKVMNLCER